MTTESTGEPIGEASSEPTSEALSEPASRPATEPPDGPGVELVGAVRDLPPVTERELAARARGLASAYIVGGEDPEIEETRRREAKYMRLLLGMVALIVGVGLLVTFVGIILAGNAR